ncbi:baseplate assembly protein [Pararhodospirillum photometricum]|uniref:baseplate assembly protein n=1 Tax=Pararhodospirillum photometricum TaxID=1084 RepID=UPI000318E7B3|nr:baseplate J/gp47 family protein [Pararhodospirillum photometricum]
MTRTWSRVDLTRLPPPEVIETLDYEGILSSLIADFKERWPEAGLLLESDPAVKLLEVAAYRELTLRARVNDAARALLLAFATGATLDHLAGLVPMSRLAGEADASFRDRVQLAPEAFSVAGPTLAYVWHARAASPDVKDVTAVSPVPGEVVVTVLSRHGDGGPAALEILGEEEVVLAPAGAVDPPTGATGLRVLYQGAVCARNVDYLYDAASGMVSLVGTGSIPTGTRVKIEHTARGEVDLVRGQLSARLVRPLTDRVTVQAANVLHYTVSVDLWLTPDGPEGEVVRQAAVASVASYTAARHRLDADVTVSGVTAAALVEGVWRAEVRINNEMTDLATTWAQAAWCDEVTVTVAEVSR